MRWPWQRSKDMSPDRQAVVDEREKTRPARAAMAEAVISFSRERNALDEMVRRHLELLGGKK